jgi:asparagine synthase (glutamine-hydrolysing)
MCGFLGWYRQQAAPWTERERERQQRALAAIAHRGPDDSSEHLAPTGWMGFRRLSILDLSTAARQPMAFDGGRHHLTFNGEIYNFRELRRDAALSSHSSTGDTAVLGELLRRQPPSQVLPQLRGMFAFAWWDSENQELFAARDRFGIKPLYYHLAADGQLLLGSELRALQTLIGGQPEISPPALAQFFRWGAVQAPHTVLRGIQCLPPGHHLRWKKGHLTIERWFTPDWPSAHQWITDPNDQREQVRQTVLGSIQAHLVADVPVGVFLSGGLDSTLVTAAMRHLGQDQIKAFSVGFEADAGVPDESDTAERTARHYSCDFFRARVTADTLFDQIDGFLDQLDQPTGDGLNTWLVSAVASAEVKVCLSGVGADEWFAGYRYLRLASLAQQSVVTRSGLQPTLQKGLLSADRRLPSTVRGHKLWKAIFYGLGGAGARPYQWQSHARSLYPAADLAVLLNLSAETFSHLTLATSERQDLEQRLTRPRSTEWLSDMLLAETETYLANTLLRDADAVSMAHSLELRVPLVDPEVFDLAGCLPPQTKLNASGGKVILRETFKDLLPEWIYDDRQKKTFTLPLMKWLRQPRWRQRIEDTLSSSACRTRGWIEPKQAARLIHQFYASDNITTSGWQECQIVWLMFVLESWALRHFPTAHA